jgi:hypothetical protein
VGTGNNARCEHGINLRSVTTRANWANSSHRSAIFLLVKRYGVSQFYSEPSRKFYWGIPGNFP